MISTERFLTVHLSAPVEVCRERDEEGHYQAADEGEIADVPGVSAPYEAPEEPDLVLPTHELSVEECADQILEMLEQRGIIS